MSSSKKLCEWLRSGPPTQSGNRDLERGRGAGPHTTFAEYSIQKMQEDV
jgi:hypothetical protein